LYGYTTGGTTFAQWYAGWWQETEETMVLGEYYRGRCGNGFDAYMALQRALLARWLSRGGTEESWCRRIAPVFRERYGPMMEEGGR
jgi:hypothetical protein